MSSQLKTRHSHRAWVSRGKLHVWGGCIEGQSSRLVMEKHSEEVKRLTKVVEVFDIKGKKEWSSVTTTGDDRPLGIRDAALALLGVDDTRAIVFGGYCGYGATCFHNSLHELDTKSWEWYVLIPDSSDQDSLAPMLKRNSGAVGFTRKGKKYVCIFGGVGLHGASRRQKNSEYYVEPRMAECTTNELHCAEITGHKAEWFWPDVTGSAPPPCADFSFIKTSDLEVVMMGGFAKTAYLHDGVYHLNLDNWEWSKIFSSHDVKRTRHFGTFLASEKILMMGGADENDATRKDMCMIDIKTGNTEMVLSEPKLCQREWHSITAFPISGSGTSVSVVVTGGVTARDKQQDPTMWPKAETNFIMEFDLIEAQDGSKKWNPSRITDLSTNISQQVFVLSTFTEELQMLKKILCTKDFKISQLESDYMAKISELEQQLKKMKELVPTKTSAVTKESATQGKYLALTGDVLSEMNIQQTTDKEIVNHEQEQLVVDPHQELVRIRSENDNLNFQLKHQEGELEMVKKISQVRETQVKELEEKVSQLTKQVKLSRAETIASEDQVQVFRVKLVANEDQMKLLQNQLTASEEKVQVLQAKLTAREDLTGTQNSTEKRKLTQTTELHTTICQQDEEIQTDIQEVNTDKKQLAEITKELEYHKHVSQTKDHHIEDLQAKSEDLQQLERLEEDGTKNALELEPIKKAQQSTKDCSLLTFIDENLCEVETWGAKLFIFEGSKAQIQPWKGYGLTIQVAQDTLSTNEQLEIAVKPIIAGRFELPKGMQLASAVYAISCSSKVKKPVMLEIQHCFNVQTEDHSKSLSFVTAKLAHGDLPYKFSALNGGAFRSKSSFGSIRLSHFCLCAIGSTDPSGFQYRACAFMKKEKQRRWKMRIVLSKDLDLHEEYNGSHLQHEEKLVGKSFIFKDEKKPVHLLLEKQQVVNGWLIVPIIYPCKVTKKEIDQSGKNDPQFVLDVFAQGDASQVLVHHMGISGTDDEELSIAITCQLEDLVNVPVPASGSSDPIPYTETVSTQNQGKYCHQVDFMDKVAAQIPAAWYNFGVSLGIDIGKLEAVEQSYRTNPLKCFSKVYYIWKQEHVQPLTWEVVVKILNNDVMAEKNLSSKLATEYNLH